MAKIGQQETRFLRENGFLAKPSGLLEARGVDFAYGDGPSARLMASLVLQGVNLSLRPGDRVALIGPNGSGKTTLLKVLNGLLTPRRGQVTLNGENLHSLSRRQVAREIAFVPQEVVAPFALTAWEVVMLGRTPHLRPLVGEAKRDREVVAEKMALTGTLPLARRPFNELSGGEQRRVVMAMALAQEPRVLLLDEPTVHLDLHHQVAVLELLQELNGEGGLTILAALHDLNLAALYFHRLVLLNGGRVISEGTPGEVLEEECLRRVFGAVLQVQRHPTCDAPHVVVLPGR